MKKIQAVRGTQDIYDVDYKVFEYIIENASVLADAYGFKQVLLPIFEYSEVFKRTLGDLSDIVTKEMYSFSDKGGEMLTLRPEFTASICRFFIEAGLKQEVPLKLFTHGPLFRYERPQKGRMRQFNQVNFEVIGSDLPVSDAEMISLANNFLIRIGLEGKYKLYLNTLGDGETRLNYRIALVDYFKKYENSLSELSKMRLDKNPLRILDSKEPEDQEIIRSAPVMTDYYSINAGSYFEKVQYYLQILGVSYNINPKLVRGLDYYTHTAFEFVTNKLGAQGTILAGGRYDKLIEQMGGQYTPAIGFASGIERLSLLLNDVDNKNLVISVIPVSQQYEDQAIYFVDLMRAAVISEIHYEYVGDVSKRMKKANKAGAKYVIFIDENFNEGKLKIKNMDSGQEETINFSSLDQFIKE